MLNSPSVVNRGQRRRLDMLQEELHGQGNLFRRPVSDQQCEWCVAESVLHTPTSVVEALDCCQSEAALVNERRACKEVQDVVALSFRKAPG